MRDRAINEFIKDVTKGMGWKQRNEVKRELEAHILDSAEALAAERKVPVDDPVIREVIQKMGPPEEIAAMYPSNKNDGISNKTFIICMAIIVALTAIIIVGLIVSPMGTILIGI